jgi:hypothetical protein
MIANPIITRSVGQLIIVKLENFTQNLVKDIAALLWLENAPTQLSKINVVK